MPLVYLPLLYKLHGLALEHICIRENKPPRVIINDFHRRGLVWYTTPVKTYMLYFITRFHCNHGVSWKHHYGCERVIKAYPQVPGADAYDIGYQIVVLIFYLEKTKMY